MARQQYVSTSEVAEMFGVSVNTVRFWRRKGTGPRGVRIGKQVFYDLDDIERWVEEQRKTDCLHRHRKTEEIAL